MATRLRRAQMVERNREAVLSAARRVFINKGYAGATLEAIAEEAGFSKGVMYSQFESKADLFLTLLERRIEERTGQGEHIVAEYTGLEGLRKLLEAGGEDARAEAAWARVLVEFRALASRDPGLNARYAAAHARTVDHLASQLDRLCASAKLQTRCLWRLWCRCWRARSASPRRRKPHARLPIPATGTARADRQEETR